MMENVKEFIAKRVAKELKDGYVVNLAYRFTDTCSKLPS